MDENRTPKKHPRDIGRKNLQSTDRKVPVPTPTPMNQEKEREAARDFKMTRS